MNTLVALVLLGVGQTLIDDSLAVAGDVLEPPIRLTAIEAQGPETKWHFCTTHQQWNLFERIRGGWKAIAYAHSGTGWKGSWLPAGYSLAIGDDGQKYRLLGGRYVADGGSSYSFQPRQVVTSQVYYTTPTYTYTYTTPAYQGRYGATWTNVAPAQMANAVNYGNYGRTNNYYPANRTYGARAAETCRNCRR